MSRYFKRYMIKVFDNEDSKYEGYLTAYVLEWYGTKTVIAKVIQNKSTFKAKAGTTRLIFCGDAGCEFFDTKKELEQIEKELKENE